MVRGGVPSQMYQECTRVDGGPGNARHRLPASSSAAAISHVVPRDPANQFAYFMPRWIVIVAFFQLFFASSWRPNWISWLTDTYPDWLYVTRPIPLDKLWFSNRFLFLFLGLTCFSLRPQQSTRAAFLSDFLLCPPKISTFFATKGTRKEWYTRARQSPWVEKVPELKQGAFPWRVGGDKFSLGSSISMHVLPHAACHCFNSGTILAQVPF